ncbi:hypothetical protein TI04_07875 [Achromatium sp. WMS2]|nr:hypothetical protein TI04_07875 [Achromatium sp. WMS2]
MKITWGIAVALAGILTQIPVTYANNDLSSTGVLPAIHNLGQNSNNGSLIQVRGGYYGRYNRYDRYDRGRGWDRGRHYDRPYRGHDRGRWYRGGNCHWPYYGCGRNYPRYRYRSRNYSY